MHPHEWNWDFTAFPLTCLFSSFGNYALLLLDWLSFYNFWKLHPPKFRMTFIFPFWKILPPNIVCISFWQLFCDCQLCALLFWLTAFYVAFYIFLGFMDISIFSPGFHLQWQLIGSTSPHAPPYPPSTCITCKILNNFIIFNNEIFIILRLTTLNTMGNYFIKMTPSLIALLFQ